MLFSAALTVAMASGAIVLSRRGALRSENDKQANTDPSDHFALAFFGASLGLAVLAKGPAGVLLAAGAIGIWVLATSRWRDALRLAHPVAIAVFCVVALPWYVLCALRNPDFLRVFIFQHNFERYLTPLFQHRQPFWYFVPILLLGLLPWTACLWPALGEGLRLWRQKSWSNSPGFFIACWAIFPFLFFSFSQSKLPGYILPAIPPLALLIAVGVQRRILATDPPYPRARLVFLIAVGVTWIVMALSAVHWVNRLPAAARDVSGENDFADFDPCDLRRDRDCRTALFVGTAALCCFHSLWPRFALNWPARASCLRSIPFISARFHGELLRNHRYPRSRLHISSHAFLAIWT